MLVIMMQQAWELDYGPKTPTAQTADVVTPVDSKEELPNAAGAQTVATNSDNSVITPVNAASTTPVIKIKTDVIALEINSEGATVQNLDLLTYPVEKENSFVNWLRGLIGMSLAQHNNAPVRLFNADKAKLFLAQSGLITSEGLPAPTHLNVFTAQQDNYELNAGQNELIVPLTWTNNKGLTVTKVFTFKRGDYAINVTQTVENHSGAAWVGRQYSQLLRIPDESGKGNMLTGGMRAYDGGVIYTQKDKYQKVSFGDMADKTLDVSTQGGWTALIQHYFATAWIPPAEAENHFYTKQHSDKRFVIGSYSPTVTVANEAQVNFTSQLFAGPKVQPMMEKIAKGLELTVDYSVLTFIGKPIYSLLNLIHSAVDNWGVAIIGVTFCIKLMFFPLSQAGFRSMARMRNVQPRLKELQERFKDDRQRFNQEMMSLYKQEKVNPLGGCLPLLVQIPVFMALYWVLSETVEFRHAPFALWIQDLASQDPFFILPLIMGVAMRVQQSLNPPPIDPLQAKVMKMFPLVFTVFFLFFPSGLVLYFVVNNTLSIIQQWYITKTIEADKLKIKTK